MTLDEYQADPEFYRYLIDRCRDSLILTEDEVTELREAWDHDTLALAGYEED